VKIHKYSNYDEYVSCQLAGNERKKTRVWAVEENIARIAAWLKPRQPATGLCHGTRGGYEQAWFAKYLDDCAVIGTEIGDASAPDTLQLDFNKRHPQLVGAFDFVYSNSFDHAYDPVQTIRIWFEQLRPGGSLILEWDRRNEHTGAVGLPVNKLDCVSMTFDELRDTIPQWVDGIELIKELDLPVVTNGFRKAIIFTLPEA